MFSFHWAATTKSFSNRKISTENNCRHQMTTYTAFQKSQRDDNLPFIRTNFSFPFTSIQINALFLPQLFFFPLQRKIWHTSLCLFPMIIFTNWMITGIVTHLLHHISLTAEPIQRLFCLQSSLLKTEWHKAKRTTQNWCRITQQIFSL